MFFEMRVKDPVQMNNDSKVSYSDIKGKSSIV